MCILIFVLCDVLSSSFYSDTNTEIVLHQLPAHFLLTADRRHQIWQRAVQVGGGAGALLKYRYKFNCKYQGVNTLKLGQKYRICLLLTSSVHAKQRYEIWHGGALVDGG